VCSHALSPQRFGALRDSRAVEAGMSIIRATRDHPGL
jgi:hypothetical protein